MTATGALPQIWGLTGGIAAGKSAAARFFAEAGWPVIDADQVARDLSAPGGAAYDAIVARFGTAERARLREIVFADPAARHALEAILHPLIQSESLRRAHVAAQSAPLASGVQRVIYEAALLVETGRYQQMHGLLVVEAPVALRRERLIKRDGVRPELADEILAAQATDEQRRAAATALLPNVGTLDELRAAVRAWIASQTGTSA